jgi:hypothetical protein
MVRVSDIYSKMKQDYIPFLPNSPLATVSKKMGFQKKIQEMKYKKQIKHFPIHIQKK